ncbi:retron Ec67 family RNA-directed DNA polymerase/endonuclease [Paraburkholderia kururiensis]|uniref:retron Ec67 family RNA-directed DNA polymerase/endonuclease n=1 Tax=Paraburkholderia kururiensis TaxID=984307 RepID=UPI000AB7809B|nr:retron Ec67 family RNA-directed DNA polymerase/endonuclease [Paraburkholderia kururiensis]
MNKITHIARLRPLSSLHGLAHLLGYTPKGLASIVYGTPDSSKYNDFRIRKRSGGTRLISEPNDRLKLLQRRLANLLSECIDDIDSERRVTNSFAHGFRKKHSILTNASRHRRKRYVFNVDLHDFFGTVDFGRISGYLKKNKHFLLDERVARMLAQIACHNKVLPQGSPCSPVMANLIAHILDVRLARLAALHDCYYSRYADDLTFSTNRADFPSSIAKRVEDSNLWVAGKALEKIVSESRFQLNPSKTRMQLNRFRQDVTGIVVNSGINVRSEYQKTVRAMVHSLVTKGVFHIQKLHRDDKGAWVREKKEGTRAQLRGMLTFIDNVRLFEKTKRLPPDRAQDQRGQKGDPAEMDSATRTFRRFLMFTQFFHPEKPLILCEGKTDKVYIQCALRRLSTAYPLLSSKSATKTNIHVSFFNYTKIASRVLSLGGGTGDLNGLVATYGSEFAGFKSTTKRHPVILLVDNDEGTKGIFSAVKTRTKSTSPITGNEPYYHVADNLYVVSLPLVNSNMVTIENFFPKHVRDTKLNGKVFSGKNRFDAKNQYGKHVFAEQVIKKIQNAGDFSGFHDILMRIQAVLVVHSAKKP